MFYQFVDAGSNSFTQYNGDADPYEGRRYGLYKLIDNAGRTQLELLVYDLVSRKHSVWRVSRATAAPFRSLWTTIRGCRRRRRSGFGAGPSFNSRLSPALVRPRDKAGSSTYWTFRASRRPSGLSSLTGCLRTGWRSGSNRAAH